MLARAARLHELGLVIAHSQYHVHGSYVAENSDIAGFSQQQQRFLAALIRTHRRGVPKSAFDALPDRLLSAARRSAALLRLAVLLHRSHENGEIPRLDLKADGSRLTLTVSKKWLEARPLVKADLYGEPEDMAGLGVQLEIIAV
jgi:exopolyphosphatase/guanosine-5'-triphosphate,3'-diphosphate pyrophosphatase